MATLPYLMLMKNPTTLQLMKYPKAFTLFCFIAQRTNRTSEDCLINGLEIGEAPIGDYETIGLTRSEYRAASKRLINSQLTTIKTTNKGSVAKIISKAIIDINLGENDQQKTKSVPKHDHKTTTTKEVRIKNKEINITNVIQAEPEKTESLEISSIELTETTPPIPDAPPPNSRREEIDKILEALKQRIGVDDFTTAHKWQRIYGMHCFNLFQKLGKDEFLKRLDMILGDGFKAKRCNDLEFVYREIKGFISTQKSKEIDYV
jgi:hypothetical protein